MNILNNTYPINTYVHFENKNVIEDRYSWSNHHLELVSFIRDYCNGICSSVFYVIKCNRTKKCNKTKVFMEQASIGTCFFHMRLL